MVVGAGITGLSAAAEAGAAGAKVLVVDMASVFGGHAMMSHGGIWVAGSPLQTTNGITDDPKAGLADILAWGEDADKGWAKRFADSSRPDVYDWLTSLGVGFETMMHLPGNSVPRFHVPKDRGYGLVSPIYRECLMRPSVEFAWNVEVTELIKTGAAVTGVRGKSLRSGAPFEVQAGAVLLATGGFQSNLDMVRKNWPKTLPLPVRLLRGSGHNSQGSGQVLAIKAGAVLQKMDHMWNYVTGLPDPNHPGEERGISVWNQSGIWVNAQGKRFVHDDWLIGGDKVVLPAVVKQKPASYWLVFDDAAKKDFRVSGTGWDDPKVIDEKIYANPDLVKTASTLAELSKAAGLPAEAFTKTVTQWNGFIDKGTDVEFGRFKNGARALVPGAKPGSKALPLPPKLEKAPFYAMQLFPLARKSLGGVRIDSGCRAVNAKEKPVAGLYAAGEVTGFAGINGRAGLEGTFLGPGVLTGRIAAQSALADLKLAAGAPAPVQKPAPQPAAPAKPSPNVVCLACHNLPTLVEAPRPGFWHFEVAHKLVLKRGYNCTQCHAELDPFKPAEHRVNPVARIDNCGWCHGKPR